MQFVEKQQQKNIKLIDGSLLADLLVKYEVGVAAAQTFKLYNDDLVMQIVETSYAYGFEAFSIEKENWDIAVLLRKYDLTRQDLEQ